MVEFPRHLRAAHVGLHAVALVLAAGCAVEDLATPTVPAPPAGDLHPVIIEEPVSLTALPTDVRDPRGGVAGVGCTSCHASLEEHRVPEGVEGMGEVHAGLVFDHGELSCRACHDHERADRLRLADGTSVEMREAMRLCAQCHGPQSRDFEHGSHGGMRGHWDRRRGPTTRNHCVDCHDPHQPRFPTYRPATAPRDRFLPRRSRPEAREDAHE